MKVNLNTATVSELMAVGFGKAAAESVIAYRMRRLYTEVPELMKTRHVGEVMYHKVRDFVFAGGPNAGGEKAMDERLESALDGVKLTEREERYLTWLSRMDGETVEVFAELFDKLRVREKMMCKRLTAEELRERVREPIWLVGVGCDGVLFGTYDIVTKVSAYSMETLRGENLGLENIGKTWAAYSGKPTDENAYAL
jgi:hypothetical protein